MRLRLHPLACAAAAGCSLIYPSSDLTQGAAGGTAGDAGAPSRCDSGFVFCDGFEHGLDAWSVQSAGGGAAAVDSAKVRRGAFALRSQMPAVTTGSNAAAGITHAQALPPHFFVRLFIFLPSPWGAPSANLVKFVTANGNGVGLYATGGVPKLASEAFNLPNAGSQHSDATAPLDAWTCIEVEMDRPNQRMRVFVEGTEIADLARQVALPASDINLELGLEYSTPAASPAYAAWFDEVAADGAAIGCVR
jgi:hypothetical protein